MVLVTVPRAKPTEMFRAFPCTVLWTGRGIRLNYWQPDSWSKWVGKVFRQYHAPCTLKTSSLDFKKGVRILVPTQLSLSLSLKYSQWQSKLVYIVAIFVQLIDVVELVLVLNVHLTHFQWMLSNQQSFYQPCSKLTKILLIKEALSGNEIPYVCLD